MKFSLFYRLTLSFFLVHLFSACLNMTDGYQGDAKLTAFEPNCHVTSSDFRSFWLGINGCQTDATLKASLYNRIKNHRVIRYLDNSTAFDASYTISFMTLENAYYSVPTRFDAWDAYRVFAAKGANPHKSGSNCAIGKILDWYDYQCYDTPTQIMSPNDGGQQDTGATDTLTPLGTNYGNSGAYNREHAWPKSWFLSGSASGYCASDKSEITGEGSSAYDYRAYTDLHHLIPARRAVNEARGNCSFGIVLTPDANLSRNSGAKKGTPDTAQMPGYSFTSPGAGCLVDRTFEPPADLKGDIARIYFYMATRYYTEDSCWNTNYAVTRANINTWLENVLRAWHTNDPVSEEERTRNNWIHRIQGNRNPFIDHPEWVAKISDF